MTTYTVSSSDTLHGSITHPVAIFTSALSTVTLGNPLSQRMVYNPTSTDVAYINPYDILNMLAQVVVPVSVTNTVGIHLSQAQLWQRGANVLDTLKIALTQSQAATYNKILTAPFNLHEALANAINLSLHAGFTLHDHMLYTRGVTLLESIGITSQVVAPGVYVRLLTDAVHFLELLNQIGAVALHELMHVTGVALALKQANATQSDGLKIHDTAARTMTAVLIVDETLEITDIDTVLGTFFESVTEELDFRHTWVLPGGGNTTWVLNTRTGALTEYTNYAFNSMTRVGSGTTYLGASSTGLYALQGPDDNGTPIVSSIRGGLLQFSGGQLSSIAGAYLAVRGYGDWYLKIKTGSGQEYVYRVDNPKSMKNNRVELGKGLRARYFSYELTSTGQDFDFNSLEFIPIQQVRRIGV